MTHNGVPAARGNVDPAGRHDAVNYPWIEHHSSYQTLSTLHGMYLCKGVAANLSL